MNKLLVLGLLFCSSLPGADFDVLIRNARVVDGTGNPWFHASVAIKDGKIAAIGTLSGATAAKVIDAAGRVLAPGFVDVHTHLELDGTGGIEKIPRADNYLLDGVTTAVSGNCGGSVEKVGDWLARLEKLGLGLNVATLIGHNTVRSAVMGQENRPAGPRRSAECRS